MSVIDNGGMLNIDRSLELLRKYWYNFKARFQFHLANQRILPYKLCSLRRIVRTVHPFRHNCANKINEMPTRQILGPDC